MSQAIIAAIEAVTGEPFDSTKLQVEQMENCADVPGVVKAIPDKLKSAVEVLAKGEDLEPHMIPSALVARALGLKHPSQRAAPNNLKDIKQVMTDDQKEQLGAIKERLRNTIAQIYLRVFDRMPDEAGFDFWNGVGLRDPEYSFGNIERDMRAAKANGAK